MKYCTRCLNVSTRPRITFNEDGVCNACQHHDEKQKTDWKRKMQDLQVTCASFKSNKNFDVIVPVSGGKDGSYVAWKLREMGMCPLCITLSPQMPTTIGKINLDNFRDQGFDHILISPNKKLYANIAKEGFIKYGQPKLPFVNGISTAVFEYARNYKIPFIMYGEEGEAEYGGGDSYQGKIDDKYLKEKYYSDIDLSNYGYWWKAPEASLVYATHWSKHEDWDPEVHARFASKNCNMQMLVNGSIGTFTNYSQLDDKLQDLHAFMMFVKYGFGRATSDACIEIRRGRMTREDGLTAVNELDGAFPLEYLEDYLKYFEMTVDEFWGVVDKFANYNVLEKTDDKSKPYILKFA